MYLLNVTEEEIDLLMKVLYIKKKKLQFSKRTPIDSMYYSAKTRANKLGIPFDIEKTDLVIPDVCPYLGIPITTNKDPKRRSNASIDKIDPTKGYVKGNVQVISYMANRMKQNASKEELIKFARSVLDLFTRA